MPLAPGQRLGSYEITAAIGKGGMGEVFRARDTKLGRDVAIKVLPAAFAQDPERLARFEREARVLASLNHTNIAHIYGFESALLADGTNLHFLVMEMVEGEDLAARLKRGAVPVDEAIAIARQIAEGLEEAHEQGIVHRDLKPANIKLAPDGKVKVLDFGLAKALEGRGADSAVTEITDSPTVSRHATEAGLIMGTAPYMSPEQARGKALDKRSDIWAFGVVVFEMLTGERLFAGETVTDVLAAVLTHEPDWRKFPAGTPESLRRIVQRSLVRDPRRRLRDLGEVRLMMRRQDQEAAVVGDQMETVVLITGRPANPAIPRRALPGRCREAQQGQPLRVMPRHIPQGMADLRQRPQVMMGLHQRLEARLISGAINGTYGDLAKVQIATLVGPRSPLSYWICRVLSICTRNRLF